MTTAAKLSYAIANGIEKARLLIPNKIRKAVPRAVKSWFFDIQWASYRMKNSRRLKALPRLPHPVLIISIPKCGTHLIRTILLSIKGSRWRGIGVAKIADRERRSLLIKQKFKGARRGHVYGDHIPYDPELARWLSERGIHRVFIFRDPRDYTVSACHFMMNRTPDFFPYEAFRALGTHEKRLTACINGLGEGTHLTVLSLSSLPNVRLFYEQYLGWMNEPGTCALRYEDFVGNERVSETIRRMLIHLGIEKTRLTDETLQDLFRTSLDPRKSPTFRLGRTGSWRNEFKPHHIEAFKRVAGDLLIRLGYEKDGNW